MKSINKKVQAIVNELIGYSLSSEAKKIDCSISIDENQVIIKVQDNRKSMDEETLNYVRRILKQPHRKDMEEYYGNLAGDIYAGDGLLGSGLNLIGFQLDGAEIESSKDGTSITVKKNIE